MQLPHRRGNVGKNEALLNVNDFTSEIRSKGETPKHEKHDRVDRLLTRMGVFWRRHKVLTVASIIALFIISWTMTARAYSAKTYGNSRDSVVNKMTKERTESLGQSKGVHHDHDEPEQHGKAIDAEGRDDQSPRTRAHGQKTQNSQNDNVQEPEPNSHSGRDRRTEYAPETKNAIESDRYIPFDIKQKWDALLQQKGIGGGEGYSGQVVEETTFYIQQIQDMVRFKEGQHGLGSENVRVCETGFNMGHSALTYLFGAEGVSQRVKVEYLGFSYPLNNHQLIAKTLKDEFGFSKRFGVLWADSTQMIPYYVDRVNQTQGLNECDIVIVDGGHSLAVATKDIRNMKHLPTNSITY